MYQTWKKTFSPINRVREWTLKYIYSKFELQIIINGFVWKIRPRRDSNPRLPDPLAGTHLRWVRSYLCATRSLGFTSTSNSYIHTNMDHPIVLKNIFSKIYGTGTKTVTCSSITDIQTYIHTPKWLQIEALSGLSELPPFSPLSRGGRKNIFWRYCRNRIIHKYIDTWNKCLLTHLYTLFYNALISTKHNTTLRTCQNISSLQSVLCKKVHCTLTSPYLPPWYNISVGISCILPLIRFHLHMYMHAGQRNSEN